MIVPSVPSFALLATLVWLFSAYFTKPTLKIFAFSKQCRCKNQAPFSLYQSLSHSCTPVCVQTHTHFRELWNQRIGGWMGSQGFHAKSTVYTREPSIMKVSNTGEPITSLGRLFQWIVLTVKKFPCVQLEGVTFLPTCCLFHRIPCKKGASTFFTATL